MDRSSAESALVEAPKAPRGQTCGLDPLTRELFLLFDLKMSILVLYLSWI